MFVVRRMSDPDSGLLVNPLSIIESGPSTAARLLTNVTRMTVRNALWIGCHAPHLPWPYGVIEAAAHLLPKAPRANRFRVQLRHTTGELFRAAGVPHQGDRVVLYIHGGGFLTCGPNTHAAMITRLSRESNAPVLAVDYRMPPKHSLGEAIDDCVDAWDWLRDFYEPGQIVIAGDSAGGYLTLATAISLSLDGVEPAALAMLSPLLQLDPEGRKRHPNIKCDAMFGPEAFDALYKIVKRANHGYAYEPLDFLEDAPPTLIHVSGHEALLHDARLAAERLAELDVPVEVVTWPGQMHVFQIAAPLIPEANRSLRQIGQFIVESTMSKSLTDRTATVG